MVEQEHHVTRETKQPNEDAHLKLEEAADEHREPTCFHPTRASSAENVEHRDKICRIQEK